MNNDLYKWLQTPCATDDLLELTKDVFYMPIGVVKKKIQYMEETFKVSVLETNFHHFLFNISQRETVASGSIEIILMQAVSFYGDFKTHIPENIISHSQQVIAQLVGAATFPISKYDENTHYAATLESLCIVNAFGGKYPQFGSRLNKFDVVSPNAKLAIVPTEEIDAVINKLLKKVKTKLSKFQYREDAQAYLVSTEFSLNIECKKIVNNLPPKN